MRGHETCAAEEERLRPWLLHDGTGNPFPWPSPQLISFLSLPRLLAFAKCRRTREWREHHACRGSKCLRGENQGEGLGRRWWLCRCAIVDLDCAWQMSKQPVSQPVSKHSRAVARRSQFFRWSFRCCVARLPAIALTKSRRMAGLAGSHSHFAFQTGGPGSDHSLAANRRTL